MALQHCLYLKGFLLVGDDGDEALPELLNLLRPLQDGICRHNQKIWRLLVIDSMGLACKSHHQQRLDRLAQYSRAREHTSIRLQTWKISKRFLDMWF